MENLQELLKEIDKFCLDNGIEKGKAGYIMGIFMKHRNTINNLAQPDVRRSFHLTELEEKRFSNSESKSIRFDTGGGIGTAVSYHAKNGKWVDITDYGCW